MDYKLLVLDVDGTLLNDEKEISVRTRSAILKIQQMGIHVVLASGRPLYSLRPIARSLEMNTYGGYLMAYNGAQIIQVATDELMYEKRIHPDMFPFIEKEARKYNLAMFTYKEDTIYTDSPDSEYVRREAELNRMKIARADDFVDGIPFSPCKVVLAGDPSTLTSIEGGIARRLAGTLSVFRSEPDFLEFAPQNVDKNYGLEILLNKINVDPENIIAVGDGIRDISMIQMAGLGIAMGNAVDSVKLCTDAFTASNNDDGVALVIEQHIIEEIRTSGISLYQLNEQTKNSLISNLGIQYTYASPTRVEAVMPVDKRTRQPFGVLHGGASLALAETISGVGSMLLCAADEIIVGMQVSGNHVSSAHEGDTVRGVATIIHSGRSTHVWNVDIFTSTDKLVSTIRVINSVLKKR